MSRRRNSGSKALWVALYWLSGLAFVVEPFRWLARRNSPAAKAQRGQVALLEAQRHQAEQSARAQHQWALSEQDRRNREYWEAAEAYRLAQPAQCSHCRNQVPAESARCVHCGAPRAVSAR